MAEQVLERIYNAPNSSELTKSEVELIRLSIAAERSGGISRNPVALTPNRHLHRMLLSIIISILCQMTGVNLVTFYSDKIFLEILGFDGLDSRNLSGYMQIWQLICAGLAIVFIDRLGRRKLLVSCADRMAIGQYCLAITTKYAVKHNKQAANISLFFDFIIMIAFPIGLFLMPQLYSAEIAPLRIRARITSPASASNWLCNFYLAEVTPIGFQSLAGSIT